MKSKYEKLYNDMMLEKLGLENTIDNNLISELEKILFENEIDYTLFFRNLSNFDNNIEGFLIEIENCCYKKLTEDNAIYLKKWLEKYKLNIEKIGLKNRKEKMNAINPKYVLRNYMAQMAIDAAEKDDYSLIDELFQLLKNPYAEQAGMEKWFAKRPDWAKDKVGCSMLSCSS